MRRCLITSFALLLLLAGAPGSSLGAPEAKGWRARQVQRVNRVTSQIGSKLGKLWQGVRGGAQATPERIRRVRIKTGSIGDWSTTCMVAAGANQAVQAAQALGPVAGSLNVVGSVGLGIYSTKEFAAIYKDVAAGKPADRNRLLDAAHSLGWSLQGFSLFSYALKSKVLEGAGNAAGAAGGSIQVGVGLCRIGKGIRVLVKDKDPVKRAKAGEQIVLGCLDTAAGACWTAQSLNVVPEITGPAFITLAGVRVAYKNRKALAEWAGGAYRRLFKKGGTPKVETVIVTKPVSPAVGNRAARAKDTVVLKDDKGNRMVATPAEVETSTGERKPAVVCTPIARN